MQANRYPGTCGCGKRVSKGRGFIHRVGDAWGVHCSACPAGMAATSGAGTPRKRKATSKGAASKWPSKRKARPATSRPGYAKSTSKRTGCKRTGAAKVGGVRRRTAVAKGCKWIAPILAAPDWSLHFTPLCYGSAIRTADGVITPCTQEYARVAAEAVAAANGPREMDLLVTLVEMRALGHLGERVHDEPPFAAVA